MIAKNLCDFLNKVLSDDPDFVNSLFFKRVLVNNLATEVLVNLDGSTSIIGLINGFLNTQGKSIITMVTDKANGKVDKFMLVDKNVFIKDEDDKS